jgi:hypothetical protein
LPERGVTASTQSRKTGSCPFADTHVTCGVLADRYSGCSRASGRSTRHPFVDSKLR